MSNDPWRPTQYERYKDERSQPFFDLLALVELRPGMRVLDVGCGTGELTRELHRRSAASRTLGIDSSESMLAKGAAFAENGLEFALADVREHETSERFDLVFSNACLQWVDDQTPVLAKLQSWLAPGGQLAVQVPANHDELPHVTAAELAREEPFATELAGYARTNRVPSPVDYATLLDAMGFERQTVRLHVYPHLLESREGVIEWVRGTLLTAYQRRLSQETWELFLERYRERLLPRLSDRRPFFFPFKRILFQAR